MKKKRALFIILCVLLCLFLTTCSILRQCSGPPNRAWEGVPKDGLWYCEELKLQLYFGKIDYENGPKHSSGVPDFQSYVIQDGLCYICNVSQERYFTMSVDLYLEDVKKWREILLADMVSLEESVWIIRNVRDDQEYTFRKVDFLHLHKFWNEHKAEIEAYTGTSDVGEVHHINIAKEKALSLWETELNVGGVWQQDDLTVSFNYENACWLIIGTQVDGKTPYALIQKSGKVDAVWLE